MILHNYLSSLYMTGSKPLAVPFLSSAKVHFTILHTSAQLLYTSKNYFKKFTFFKKKLFPICFINKKKLHYEMPSKIYKPSATKRYLIFHTIR